ncbi:hypothetical protein FUA23_16075 [Neolewinella aurantiaca]|uniref:Putative beta-lactamase-inhibitor-like PepSY-like domain-containing protein n=1 Tax=Neolewinella aurantiaca TaxID=2602767 RepID=A0A5C7FRP0_9BACT|nr:PepSY-like domain-containing protein [Neolewinella aurantiaca]TXF88157.1 hypothetical protein FUA23_16075 [Neolewinella aurantiaca]
MNKQFFAFVAFTILFACNAYGQSTSYGEVPSVVKNHFSSNHPQSVDVEWKREGEFYRVEFETGTDADYKIWYDSGSNVVRKEAEILPSELPRAIVNTINAQFEGYTIDDVDMITTPQGTTYEVELEALLKKDWEVVFSADGKVLAKVKD